MGKRGYGSLVMKFIKCSLEEGKTCTCQNPDNPRPHGPYFYHVISVKKKQHWLYLGTAQETLWKILTDETYSQDWKDCMIKRFKNLTSTSNVGKSHFDDLTKESTLGKIEWKNGKLELKMEG